MEKKSFSIFQVKKCLKRQLEQNFLYKKRFIEKKEILLMKYYFINYMSYEQAKKVTKY